MYIFINSLDMHSFPPSLAAEINRNEFQNEKAKYAHTTTLHSSFACCGDGRVFSSRPKGRGFEPSSGYNLFRLFLVPGLVNHLRGGQ